MNFYITLHQMQAWHKELLPLTFCSSPVYVNHRPAFGLSPEKLLWAFETLAGSAEDGNSTIERGDLLDILQKNGETWCNMLL